MGIYDREYYRGEARGPAWLGGNTPAWKALIFVNVGMMLVQLAFQRHGGEFFRAWLEASPTYTLHHLRLWQLLTATFLHAGLWHLLVNMLFLWFIGIELEGLYGSRDFLAFYLCAAVLSTLGWVLWSAAAPDAGFRYMLGASGAIMALLTVYTLLHPRREVLFLFFIPMPMWLIWVIYVALPIFPALSGAASDVAIESHLCGAAFGALFWKYNLRWSYWFSGRAFRPRLRIFSPVGEEGMRRARPSGASRTGSGAGRKSGTVSVLPEEQLDARLDEVLAKIVREGREGLTEDELRVLQEASRRAQMRRGERV